MCIHVSDTDFQVSPFMKKLFSDHSVIMFSFSLKADCLGVPDVARCLNNPQPAAVAWELLYAVCVAIKFWGSSQIKNIKKNTKKQTKTAYSSVSVIWPLTTDCFVTS